MNSIFIFIGTVITSAVITAILWELKVKGSKKKLLDKINSLQDGLNSKQELLQKAEIKIISLNSHCNLLEAAIAKKESIIKGLTDKLGTETPVVSAQSAAPQQSLRKKRGPYKKKKNYGGSTSNNNKTEKNK
jgi:hypothetical protein